MNAKFRSVSLLTLLALFGALGLNSCKEKVDAAAGDSKGGAGGTSIGVIDLNRAAKDIGWETELNANLAKLKTNLEEGYKKVMGDYEAQFLAKKKEFGLTDKDTQEDITKKLTPAQQQELGQMMMLAQRINQQLNQAANQEVQNYHAQALQNYRDALEPLVMKVAQEKKLSVVITQPGPLLYVDPAVNITDYVVNKAKESPPTVKPVQLQTIQVPPSISISPTTQSATQPSSKPATTPAKITE